MREATNVCVLGAWHLGSVASVCLADLGYSVTGLDRDAGITDNLSKGISPLFEPGLEELLKANLAAGRLRYTTDLAAALDGARYVWITYDTPVDEQDEVDLSGLVETAREIAPLLESRTTVIVSSQVPVGTCGELAAMIREINPGLEFGMVYTPENLRLGHAIARFKAPAMLVLGADDEAALDRAEALFAVIDAPKLRVSLKTAEMTKHAINAFLATCVGFAGEIALACDAVGADAVQVAAALRLDERIGPKARVSPGPGFSGGTLARDMRILQHLGERHGYETPLIDAVLAVSDRQNRLAVQRLREIFGSLEDRRFGVLGLTYTPNTSTLRRSMSIAVIQELSRSGARVKAYDPKADRDEARQHPECYRVEDPYEVARGADALLLLTEWPQFQQLDFARIRSLMARPLLIDARNMFSPEAMRSCGFEYVGIGRGLGK